MTAFLIFGYFLAQEIKIEQLGKCHCFLWGCYGITIE